MQFNNLIVNHWKQFLLFVFIFEHQILVNIIFVNIFIIIINIYWIYL